MNESKESVFKRVADNFKNKTDSSNANQEKMHAASETYFYGMNKAVWSNRNYHALATNGYMQNVIAYRAIDIVAKAAASIPIKIQRINDGIKYPVLTHHILNLLNAPNPLQGGRELMEALYTCRLLSGNAYILGIGQNISNKFFSEIHLLNPDRIQLRLGEDCNVISYQYQTEKRKYEYASVNNRSNNKNGVVLHLKNYHPLSDCYGLSPLEVATFSIDQHNQASAWNQSLLQNGARPSGAVLVKNSQGQGCTLTDEQFGRLKSMIDDVFSGPENAGRPLLLEGGLEWKEMSMSPKDMDYIESKNSAAREIALALGVPPQLLGIPGDNTYSNLAEARVAMWEQTVLPLVDTTLNHLSRWFSACANLNQEEEIYLVADLENISALGYRLDTIWKRLENNNFMTINEKRQKIGLEPLASGDHLVNIK